MGSFKYFTSVFKVDSYGAKFHPLLHFIKRYKVPWILKWQYDKEGDVLTRRWYVKWWDKFPRTQGIVDNVTRDFLSPNILLVKCIVQIAELANALASTSTSAKTVKPPAKPKKKDSPLKEIRKNLDALYALLKKLIKEEEAAANHDLEDELSSKAFVTKNPYYPYN